jgi:hypothetical protein
MSNPFLKSNNSTKENNRFNILNNEQNNISDKKKEKKVTQYESNNNSFTNVNNKYSRSKHIINSKTDNSKTDNSKTDNSKTDNSKTDNSKTDNSKLDNSKLDNSKLDNSKLDNSKNIDFLSSQELFPELILKINDLKTDNNYEKKSDNYKNAINLQVEESKNINQNKITPGWTQIKIVNGKIIMTNGPKSTYEIKKEKESSIKNTPHFIMNKSINLMQQNWDIYSRYYDSLYGEGSYNETFVSYPIYDSDYDTDSDEDDELQNEDDDEYYDFQ